MFTRTLAQLQTSVATMGAYENSGDITATVLLEYINKALVKTYDVLVACRDDFYVRTAASFTLVSGQQLYALPTDFYSMRLAQLQDGSRWRKLLPTSLDLIDDTYQFTSPHARYRYVLSNQGILLGPTPTTSSDVVRIKYTPLAPQLAIPTDSVTFDRPQECDLVLNVAYRSCRIREDLDTVQVDQEIAMLGASLRTVADTHDDGEPYKLGQRNRRRGGDYGGGAY